MARGRCGPQGWVHVWWGRCGAAETGHRAGAGGSGIGQRRLVISRAVSLEHRQKVGWSAVYAYIGGKLDIRAMQEAGHKVGIERLNLTGRPRGREPRGRDEPTFA